MVRTHQVGAPCGIAGPAQSPALRVRGESEMLKRARGDQPSGKRLGSEVWRGWRRSSGAQRSRILHARWRRNMGAGVTDPGRPRAFWLSVWDPQCWSSCWWSWQRQRQPRQRRRRPSPRPAWPAAVRRAAPGTSCRARARPGAGAGGGARALRRCPAAAAPEPERTRASRCNDYPRVTTE